MKKLYEIRKRRFDELVEFDERIIEEDRKWQYYNKNPDQWQSNVVDKAALLGMGALGAMTAMDAMAGEDEEPLEEFNDDGAYDDVDDEEPLEEYDDNGGYNDVDDDDYDDGGGDEMRIDEWSKNNLNIPPMLTDHISDSVDPLPSNEL